VLLLGDGEVRANSVQRYMQRRGYELDFIQQSFYALVKLEVEYRLYYSIVATILKADLYLGRNWMFVAELMLANIRWTISHSCTIMDRSHSQSRD
jgi:hypothetical protein